MTLTTRFMFHGALQDFLSQAGPRDYCYTGHPSIKDAIEAQGIPHPEVGAIFVDNKAVDQGYGLQGGESVAVYPVFAHPPVAPAFALPQQPASPIRFVLDIHLGKLARYLRLAGFDTYYDKPDPGDAAIARQVQTRDAVLLTRDIGLLKRKEIRYGHWLRATESRQQFQEVVTLYRLREAFHPFSRCVHCNNAIYPIAKTKIQQLLPRRVAKQLQQFYRCEHCGQVYWKGSHYQRMRNFLDRVGNSPDQLLK